MTCRTHATAKLLTNGWSINGLLRLSSGQPYNLNSFENFNNSNEFFERPDVVGNPFAGTGGHNKLLNLGAFAAPCDWDPVNGVCFGGNPLRQSWPQCFRRPGFQEL